MCVCVRVCVCVVQYVWGPQRQDKATGKKFNGKGLF
jgi:hypothetical protein